MAEEYNAITLSRSLDRLRPAGSTGSQSTSTSRVHGFNSVTDAERLRRHSDRFVGRCRHVTSTIDDGARTYQVQSASVTHSRVACELRPATNLHESAAAPSKRKSSGDRTVYEVHVKL